MPEHPTLHTPRLTLRRFAPADRDALFAIFSDPRTNTFLPWFPLQSREQALEFYASRHAGPAAAWEYHYAICRREDDLPIGYLDLGGDCHDLGYGLRSDCWGRGYAAEAAAALVAQARRDGLLWLTATHDVNNPRSGRVMQKLGMRYCYTYREQWQPKNIPVSFRLYQLNLDGDLRRVCRRYWDASAEHWVESGL